MMLEAGFLLVPLVGMGIVFATVIVAGNELAIAPFSVTPYLEGDGHTSQVVTDAFIDRMRDIDITANSSIHAVRLDHDNLQISVSELGSFFQIDQLVEGVRNMLGLVRYHISGSVTGGGSGNVLSCAATDVTLGFLCSASGSPSTIVLTVRVFDGIDTAAPTQVHVLSGSPDDLPALLGEAAEAVVADIDPYIGILYWRNRELACYRSVDDCGNLDPDLYVGQEFTFPRMNAVATAFFETGDVAEHAPAYGLLGRAYMLKAEHDPTLTPEAQQETYDLALQYLDAALLQDPEFLFAYINQGLIAERRGDLEAADRAFADAVLVDPQNINARAAWGGMLVRADRHREAAFQYVAAVDLAPEDPSFRAALSDVYVALGHVEAARDQIFEAVRLRPLDADYRGRLAELDAVLGEADVLAGEGPHFVGDPVGEAEWEEDSHRQDGPLEAPGAESQGGESQGESPATEPVDEGEPAANEGQVTDAQAAQ